MKPGETIHLGDGAYLHNRGDGVELRANHHENPTDRVFVDIGDIPRLIARLGEVVNPRKEHDDAMSDV